MKKGRSVVKAAQSTQDPSNRLLVYLLLAVSVISLWVFHPVLANGFVNWDDQIYLAELGRMVRFSWSSLRWMWTSLQPFYFQPIAWMTHLADYQIWGANAVGHHATNWVLHGIYVALVGTLVWMLTGAAKNLRVTERLVMSAGIALVCGIHPLQVESVAWVAARNGLLCSVWMVATLCAYVRAVGSGGVPKRSWWWATIALQAIALLTKPFAVSLPLVMLALDFFPLRRNTERGWGRLLAEKWLMIALSIAAAVGAVAAQEHLNELVEYTFWSRVLVAARGVVFYLWKLIWPAWLSPFYPLDSRISLHSEEFLVPLLFCAVVTIVAVWQRARVPVLAAAWWSYLAVLGPVLGLLQVGGQAVADRYAYLAMVPALIAIVSGLVWLWRRGSMVFKTVLIVVLGLWFTFLGLSTREQIPVWHDDLSLWGTAVGHFPDNPLANYNVALALLKKGHLEEARVTAERAVKYSDPRTPQLPLARSTLGAIYLKTHAYNLAVEQLQQAIKADGTLWAARYNLACSYARLGRLEEAYDELQTVIVAQPEYARLASRDSELGALRDDPAYGARLIALIRGEGR
jgi:tetratricopeptide (TPR) repeat protein